MGLKLWTVGTDIMVPSFGLPATEMMRTHCRGKHFGKFYIKNICVIWSDELFVFIICIYYVNMIPVHKFIKFNLVTAKTKIWIRQQW